MVEKKATGQDQEEQPQSARELVENLRDMIDEAERMIVETATHQMDETVEELRRRLQNRLDQLKARYERTEERLVDTAAAADAAIREKPYQSLAMATGIGVLIGLWLNRGR